MTVHIDVPESEGPMAPRIVVIGVGGAGGNAVNNMIQSNVAGVEFLSANTDSQAIGQSLCEHTVQLGQGVTQGLGAGSRPDIGRAAAEEALDQVLAHIDGANMVFITAGLGGGTGTGGSPVIARAAREAGILTVGVVTKPFHFEGVHRMRIAEEGIAELSQYVDTLIVIPNQNLFRIADAKTTFADAFKIADQVLHSGVRGVTDLMVMPGLINLDFADIRAVMTEMGKAIMGTGEASGEGRAIAAAEAAISNPLLDDVSMKGARGVLINITGGMDLTLFEVDEAANRIRDEVDPEANIIFGSTFIEAMDGQMRVSIVATGIDAAEDSRPKPIPLSLVISRSAQNPEKGESANQGAMPIATEAGPSVFVGPVQAETGLADAAAPDGRQPEGTSIIVSAADAKLLGTQPRNPATKQPSVEGALATKTGETALRAEDAVGQEVEPQPEFQAAPYPLPSAEAASEEPPPVVLKNRTDPESAASTGQPGTKTKLRFLQPSPPRGSAGKEDLGTPLPDDLAAAPAAVRPRRRKSNGIFAWMTSGVGGGVEEQFQKAERYYYGHGVRKNFGLALRAYRKAAEYGHPAAQNRLGWMYEKGEGADADYGQAVEWYRRAAEQGHVNAMNDLGYMYRQGWGVQQNYSDALRWFGKAAEKYDSYAEYNMGQMFENGWGVDKDMDEAIRWFRRAAARGHEWAAKRLEELGVNA